MNREQEISLPLYSEAAEPCGGEEPVLSIARHPGFMRDKLKAVLARAAEIH